MITPHPPSSVLLADRCEKQKLCYHSCSDVPAGGGDHTLCFEMRVLSPKKTTSTLLDGPVLRWNFLPYPT